MYIFSMQEDVEEVLESTPWRWALAILHQYTLPFRTQKQIGIVSIVILSVEDSIEK